MTASLSRSRGIASLEFTILIALMMSIVAISIDAVLPALGIISRDLQLTNPNQAQLIVSCLFLGLALGQLICGPLSDALGRKKVLYVGISLYLLGSVLCYLAQDLNSILLGRFIQGLGVAGPYVSAISIVRDKFSGRQMARVMSLVMMIFIMVPALAPGLGQLILIFADWHFIFLFYVFYALLICVWIYFRLAETLPREKRILLNGASFFRGFKEVLCNRISLSYTICMGLFFGSFIGYLNSSQQIFQQQFHTGDLFALYFGLLALVFGGSSLVNSRLVERLGMHYICQMGVRTIIVSSALFLCVHLFVVIQLWMFLIYGAVLFFAFGLIFGNLNAIAMEPMGHIAGIASATIGAVSSILSMSLGTFIGQLYNNTLIPVTSGFMLLGIVSLAVMYLGDKGRRVIEGVE
jgi:MFS transporter, DHA1 family, multidrug resistance protein